MRPLSTSDVTLPLAQHNLQGGTIYELWDHIIDDMGMGAHYFFRPQVIYELVDRSPYVF